MKSCSWENPKFNEIETEERKKDISEKCVQRVLVCNFASNISKNVGTNIVTLDSMNCIAQPKSTFHNTRDIDFSFAYSMNVFLFRRVNLLFMRIGLDMFFFLSLRHIISRVIGIIYS